LNRPPCLPDTRPLRGKGKEKFGTPAAFSCVTRLHVDPAHHVPWAVIPSHPPPPFSRFCLSTKSVTGFCAVRHRRLLLQARLQPPLYSSITNMSAISPLPNLHRASMHAGQPSLRQHARRPNHHFLLDGAARPGACRQFHPCLLQLMAVAATNGRVHRRHDRFAASAGHYRCKRRWPLLQATTAAAARSTAALPLLQTPSPAATNVGGRCYVQQ
jgi:hypothetical protein